ncbi:MAG: YgiQ family radical SAM protein [Candidatus Omnitrophota bacterium]|nr:YgiQ family radical SAM protein [Candidatus Omnitrophota bacterium]
MNNDFLPICKKDMELRGMNELDVILITGDAYVDHPSYGTAVIGRALEGAGFTVGIIAQPDPSRLDDFMRLGRPGLFFGVTAGNLDSMVANFTANKKPRSEDDYSPGGKSGLRPDRAVIVYTNKIRQAFPGAIVVIGGIEASLRRLAHYDYWSDTVKRSILLDSKADILVYGMGERQILEIARRLKDNKSVKTMQVIPGTVFVKNIVDDLKNYELIPSFEEVFKDNDKFLSAFLTLYSENDPVRGKTIVQKHGTRFVVQYPPAKPFTASQLDYIYGLNYTGRSHPIYDKKGGVPGFETVKLSIISHRGCAGECSFCSLFMHQGRIVQSRSRESILNEIKNISQDNNFRGTITDIGGPTANLYAAKCARWNDRGACAAKKCLTPKKCKNLELGYKETIGLWEDALKIPGVKHVFVGSGVRYDLLTDEFSDEYLQALCEKHVSGQLKVAPEHCEASILKLMNKPYFDVYENFIRRFRSVNKHLRKEQYLVNYIISAHPGATLESALALSLKLMKMNIYPEQIQDYIPLPMTASGCMYHTEKDFFTGSPIHVAKGERERKLQRALIQYKNPENKRYVVEALRALNKTALAKRFFQKS